MKGSSKEDKIQDSAIVCKHCGETLGPFYSQIDEHLWTKHREIMMLFLSKQIKRENKG